MDELIVARRDSRTKETDALHGLSCPNCGGMVPIPEGQRLVECPYCSLRSLVRGERGLQRYQVPLKLDRRAALQALKGFLSSSMAIARQAGRQSRLQEAFVAFLPFWVYQARVLGWVFGQEKVGSGDDERLEPREVKIAQQMSWNRAACDVGEFGVEAVPLTSQPLEPFVADRLHAQGLVFEAIGSLSEARKQAEENFHQRVVQMADLDRVEQVITREVDAHLGIVYYPLWVLRYLYRGRSFQVVIDGFSGQVLFGKAPGNTVYRAAILVGGIALGAFLMVDLSTLAFVLASNLKGDSAGGALVGGLILIGIGFSTMFAAYRKFRYGEQFVFRRSLQKLRRVRRRKERGVLRAREEVR